jgi:hypothetical protein
MFERMDMDIRICSHDTTLTVGEFLSLFTKVWPVRLNSARTEAALQQTLNTTARHGDQLVGCIRILSDGYLMGAVTEVVIDPDYTHLGLAKQLLQNAATHSPTNLVLAVQSADEAMMQELGWRRGPTAYYLRKETT